MTVQKKKKPERMYKMKRTYVVKSCEIMTDGMRDQKKF